MRQAPVTGANKGIGFEIAKGLRSEGVDVIIGARDRRRGADAARALDVGFLQLDITDDESAARIVNVSSNLASLTRALDTTSHLSPTARRRRRRNAVTLQYALALRGTPIKINAADPGHSRTDINGRIGNRSPAEAARLPVRLSLLPDDGPTGAFISNDGEVPW